MIPNQRNEIVMSMSSTDKGRLSGQERKFGDVCGEEFSTPARREVLPHGHQSISYTDL